MRTTFETQPHRHIGRFYKQELAIHLTQPHLRSNGSWSSMADDIAALMKWRREELERQHEEFHS